MYDMVSHCNRFANAAGPGRGVGVDPKALELASGPKRVAERGGRLLKTPQTWETWAGGLNICFFIKGGLGSPVRFARGSPERRASSRARRVRFARGSPGHRHHRHHRHVHPR